MPNFERFGVMLDVSRNAVIKVTELKKYIDYISKMGYNCLELYAEDTYKIDGEPYLGYLRGGYTKEEIKEIDAYAKSKGIELIPCIQTLAHITNMCKIPHYWDIIDCDDILLIGSEKTYAFLDNIFKSLAENFSSREVNIGMDEADKVGLGNYLHQNGYTDRTELLLKHLNRVAEIAKKYGFHCHMWSDMFFRLASGGYYYIENGLNIEVSPEIKNKIPDNVSLTYWDYYHTGKGIYDVMFKEHKKLDDNVWFAGGAWIWQGFTPLNEFSIRTMKPAFESAVEHGVKNAIVTVWGDDGHEASFYGILPSLFAISKFKQGVFDMDNIKAEFKKDFNLDFDSFMALDLPNQFTVNGVKDLSYSCVTKAMFYSDVLLGVKDIEYAKFDPIPYKEIEKTIKTAKENAGEFKYIFDTLEKLCGFMKYKATLGIEARKAYKQKDLKALKQVVKKLTKSIKALDKFIPVFKNQWFIENKPFGWEVQILRLGSLRARLIDSKERINDYLKGKITKIEELEEELLPWKDRNGFMYHRWRESVTTSTL